MSLHYLYHNVLLVDLTCVNIDNAYYASTWFLLFGNHVDCAMYPLCPYFFMSRTSVTEIHAPTFM